MNTGPLPFPRPKLNPEFRLAVQTAMRDKRPSGAVLTLRVGFSHQSRLSNLLHSHRVVASPLVVSQLQKTAQVVGFVGELFEPDVEA